MQSRPAWLTCVSTLAFLIASVANAHAHVHLCTDGQEPSSAVHVDHGHLGHDSQLDDHHAQAEAHDDVDVDVGTPAAFKTPQFELPICIPAAVWQFDMPVERAVLPLRIGLIELARPPPRHWRPLLRAPPL